MDYKTKIEIASIRLALIQLAFNETYPDATKKQYYERICASPVKLPGGKEVKYAYGTLACWESDYRHGGFVTRFVPQYKCYLRFYGFYFRIH